MMKVSESTFSKYLAEAERRGWVIKSIPEWQVPPEIMDKIYVRTSKYRPFEHTLTTRVAGSTLKGLRIFSSGQVEDTRESWEARLGHFACPASMRVLELLHMAENVGIAWGHTMAALVAVLERHFRNARRRAEYSRLRFSPTCGEPLGAECPPERSSSALAAQLSAIWDCGSKPLSLAGVPAVIPAVFTGEKRQGVREYITLCRDYRRIFGPATEAGAIPLVDQIDTLITSVGSFSQNWQMYQDQLIQYGGIPIEQLREFALGDISGALIPRSGLSASQQEVLRCIAALWTGIKLEHCQRIARDAAKHQAPGVIVVAIGSNKAGVILELIQQGLVNELIIDHDLAGELKRLLKGGRRARGESTGDE
jgi:DNA-binding transcriptional regulator LsrR (DeoR family)